MPKIVDHSHQRKIIALAAADAIADHGLEIVKLSDIARRANVTTGAVSHYFENKNEVLIAALNEVWGRLFFKIERDGPVTSIDYLFSLLPITEQKQRDWKIWLAFCGKAATSEQLQQIYARFYHTLEQQAGALLPIADKRQSREAAATIIAALDGIGLYATLLPDQWPAERQRAVLRNVLDPIFQR